MARDAGGSLVNDWTAKELGAMTWKTLNAQINNHSAGSSNLRQLTREVARRICRMQVDNGCGEDT